MPKNKNIRESTKKLRDFGKVASYKIKMKINGFPKC